MERPCAFPPHKRTRVERVHLDLDLHAFGANEQFDDRAFVRNLGHLAPHAVRIRSAIRSIAVPMEDKDGHVAR